MSRSRVLRRVGAMALLWSMVLLSFSWTLSFHQAFGLRQALMEEAREEAAGGMSGIQLRDSAGWAADERRFAARIGEMRRAAGHGHAAGAGPARGRRGDLLDPAQGAAREGRSARVTCYPRSLGKDLSSHWVNGVNGKDKKTKTVDPVDPV
jgi:hypothetical protein